ncbi:hypothetical protein QU487_02500 [Crenobacter sp. SG2305]|uniref:hypothetical protein n=1 Tax=Crenobacter oryzisoli TaxID=3056844 RepID=UPI0025AAE51E|nr:hypothetical protein [Crenobacter sp. SG2305]MDN0081631.1 hypothetical protein [Crenobacter sp. SG2305]
MQATSKQSRSRAPNGIDRRVVAMRLFPDERAQLDSLARQMGISDSATAAVIYRKGLAAMQAEHTA